MKARRVSAERRRLGTTAGGGTYMVTLPKSWVEALGLEKGEILTLVRLPDGIYLRAEHTSERVSAQTRLTIDEHLQGEGLARALISRYIAGFDIIEIVGPLSVEQREVVRRTAQRLIGAEILQETADYLLIHTLRDPQVLSPSQLLEYIHENVEAMLQDAPDALLRGDLDRALSVVQRDDRVDRFFLLLSRQLYTALRDPLGEVERGISRVEFFNLNTVARQLERVADHAVKIAQAAQALIEEGRQVPTPLGRALTRVRSDVQDLLRLVLKAFRELSGGEAHRVLATIPPIERRIEEVDRQLLQLGDPHLAYHLGIVVDSLSRVKDYAANVAEIALNAEALGD
jgi:phosphate uptake regulator